MIIVRIWDGLGNQLFQYAYARKLKERGFDVRIDVDKFCDDQFEKYQGHDRRDNVIDKFNITVPGIDMREYGKYDYLKRSTFKDRLIYRLSANGLWKYRLYEEKKQAYSEQSDRITDNHYVKGWFQSEKYFSDIRDVLLKELTLKEGVSVPDNLKQLFESNEKVVSIHVRRGDYTKILMALPPAYYKQAMDQVEKTVNDPVYLVFSDDVGWVKRKLGDERRLLYISDHGTFKDYEELMLMSMCNAHIISNSTFGWWGAWLNRRDDKLVVAPKKWFDDQTGIIPDEWTII